MRFRAGTPWDMLVAGSAWSLPKECPQSTSGSPKTNSELHPLSNDSKNHLLQFHLQFSSLTTYFYSLLSSTISKSSGTCTCVVSLLLIRLLPLLGKDATPSRPESGKKKGLPDGGHQVCSSKDNRGQFSIEQKEAKGSTSSRQHKPGNKANSRSARSLSNCPVKFQP